MRIAELIPHQGAMCLLAAVTHHDAEHILCIATSHRDPANPLRRDEMLPATAGVEYAGQAMALHGALLDGGAQKPGFLSALRGFTLSVDRLDDIAAPLEITATALARESVGLIYSFCVAAAGTTLLEGQATVMLPP
ncbi:MAG: fabA fabZ [Rhodospirillales bacterium]|jgi:predicted hotdog family 3-hydroxylacyl-ACP dehydratase|nr:fabA fabZ [Rhodospirillales bacterium]